MFFKKKNKTLLCFRHFAEKHSDISEEIFQQGCKKSFPNVQRDILKERDIFWRRKLVLYWIPAFEQKSLLVWGKCFSKVIRTQSTRPKKPSVNFFEMKYIFFRFISKNGRKVFGFGEKILARLLKLGVQRNTLRKIDLFVQKTTNWFFSVSECVFFQNLTKLWQQF